MMKHIYYKNDFAVEITLLNASGEVVAPPEWQWHIEFTDGRRKYICSVERGNAKVVGNTIMCYLDNHKFCCGEVGYKFVQAIPDLNYLDGFQNLVTPKALPIELWEQESDNDVNIQSSVVPAYVVYDAYQTAKANGYTGTAEDFYDALIHIVDINTAEAERVTAEANRVSAEQQRVENFVAMESALTTATSKANTATSKANTATTKAEEASKRADNSATAASQARVQATLAANGANAAAAQATQAMEKTNEATENANNSAVNATNATTEAKEATKSANDATEKAKTATTTTEQSAERANTAADNADVATSNATQATTQATTATKRANDISADLEAKREADYWRGAKGEKGDDGVSPTVKTSKTGKVTTIEITDAKGTHTATVNDGDSVEVVQSTGTSESAVMSQKASTMAFAANTPSGDPMHNLYLSIGAIWNSDTGFWEMNTLTDLTNEDMSNIYTMGFVRPLGNPRFEFSPFTYAKRNFIKARTTVKSYYQSTLDIQLIYPSFTWNCNIEVINFLDKYKDLKTYNFVCFSYCWKLKKILDSVSPTTVMTLNECKELEEVYFLLNHNTSFKDSPKLSIVSVKYMVENASSSAITITLHPEAYERAIADAGVQAALANKTNVSLAKGE